MVQGVHKLFDGYEKLVVSGKLTLEQAQSNVISSIRMFRYGENDLNYFWIQDYNGKIIFHPALDSTNGVNPSLYQSLPKVAMQVAQLVKKSDEGFITYLWYPLNNSVSASVDKEAFVKGYQPWGWIIGTGFLTQDIENDLQQLTSEVMFNLLLLALFFLAIISFVLIRNYRNLQKIIKTDIELQKREARFRGFVEHIDNGLLIMENDKVVFVNGLFCSIFDISPEDTLHFRLENYLADWEKERVKMIMATSANNAHVEFASWLKLKGGKERFVDVQYTFDNTLNKSVYLIVRDQTEYKHQLNTIDILSESIAHSSDAVVITNLNGEVEYVNPGFEKVTGYTFNEVKGKKTNVLKSGKMDPIIYQNMWDTISNGEIWRGELLNKKKDETLFWESTIIFPIKNRNNEIIKYSAIKTDITQNKRIEQELLAARDKAEEINRYKTAFLNNISHEVRTPLNAISGFAQVLRHKPTSENIEMYIGQILQNSNNLLELFEDILDVSSIESKAVILSKEDVPLQDFLLKTVSKFNSQLTVDNKPVEISVVGDENFETMILFADRKRLSQIFDQLLSNAVKYTIEGHIQISYKIDFENLVFYISDTGVGIPDTERELIFESFSHGENLYVSLHKGVGLGLNIAKMLIELFGGKLSFVSEVGNGSTFYFNIPTTDVKNYKINGSEIDNYPKYISRKHIMIAEDNDENFDYLVAILGSDNTIVRAHTGLEAVNLVQNNTHLPDIILMDVLMPKMDGILASKMIRKMHPDLPIIAVSAICNEIEPADQLHFNFILTKPIKVPLLIETIRKYTG
jgi:PAS domain S-box-containing protein